MYRNSAALQINPFRCLFPSSLISSPSFFRHTRALATKHAACRDAAGTIGLFASSSSSFMRGSASPTLIVRLMLDIRIYNDRASSSGWLTDPTRDDRRTAGQNPSFGDGGCGGCACIVRNKLPASWRRRRGIERAICV